MKKTFTLMAAALLAGSMFAQDPTWWRTDEFYTWQLNSEEKEQVLDDDNLEVYVSWNTEIKSFEEPYTFEPEELAFSKGFSAMSFHPGSYKTANDIWGAQRDNGSSVVILPKKDLTVYFYCHVMKRKAGAWSNCNLYDITGYEELGTEGVIDMKTIQDVELLLNNGDTEPGDAPVPGVLRQKFSVEEGHRYMFSRNDKSSNGHCFFLGLKYLPEGETNAIESVGVDVENVEAPVYNVYGQRVDESYQGLVIKNGKKYFQK